MTEMKSELHRVESRPRMLEMRFTVDSESLRVEGMAVVDRCLRDARHAWRREYDKMVEADKTWQEVAADAFGVAFAERRHINGKRP